MFLSRQIGIASFAALLLTASARADTLDSLLSGGILTDGTATYTNFTWASGQIPPASTINVTASTVSGVSTITFTRTAGNWNAPTDASVIAFDATFTNPINSVALSFVANAQAGGAAFVGETLVDTMTNAPIELSVFTDGAGAVPDNLVATVPLTSPSSTFHVFKSIDTASSPGGSASIVSVSNIYSTDLGGVPEPATLALLAIAAPALLLRRRVTR